jgi:hypothetical protein
MSIVLVFITILLVIAGIWVFKCKEKTVSLTETTSHPILEIETKRKKNGSPRKGV